jgi:hypothetical protein
MWFDSTFSERQFISKRKEGYHGRQRRKKGQRQSSKTKSQPTEKKGKKEIAQALSLMELGASP